MEKYLKGADYERQIRDHLLLQPDVVNAWLWKDIPESVLEDAGILYDFEKTRKQRRKAWETEHCLPDTGTDILAIKTDQPHVLLQAKNFNGTVQQADLAGFYRMQLIFDLPGEIWFPNKVSGVVADMPPGYTKTKLVKFAYEETPATEFRENQVRVFSCICIRHQWAPKAFHRTNCLSSIVAVLCTQLDSLLELAVLSRKRHQPLPA